MIDYSQLIAGNSVLMSTYPIYKFWFLLSMVKNSQLQLIDYSWLWLIITEYICIELGRVVPISHIWQLCYCYLNIVLLIPSLIEVDIRLSQLITGYNNFLQLTVSLF